MRFFNNYILGVCFVGIFIANNAFAFNKNFESVRDYHNQEIQQLLKDYSLEDSLTIRLELKRKVTELKEQEVVSLPGIYQKTGEASDQNIDKVLNLYERKFVFIQKREISEEEIKLVKSSLTERLYLPKDTVFTTLDSTPKVDKALKNLKTDFIMGAYNTLIQNGQFLWILIFSIGFIIALFVLAKVWKNKSEGAGGEISMSGGNGGGPTGSSETQIDSATSNGGSQVSMNQSDLETFNFKSLCQNLSEAYAHAPGSTSHVLWQKVQGLQTQIQFYEVIRMQNQIDEVLLTEISHILDKVFSFKTRASNHLKIKNSGLNKQLLSELSIELTKLRFIEPLAEVEKSFALIYPQKADVLEMLFAKGLTDHSLVFYKLYKDQFMNYISSCGDPLVLKKINDLLMFDPDTDKIENEKFILFQKFISETEISSDELAQSKTVNSKILKMIYGLSEQEIKDVEAMKTNEELREKIPTFEWINIDDHRSLKDFYNALHGAEIKALFDFSEKFKNSLAALDERAQFRVKEKMKSEESLEVNWKQFRDKIGSHYKYKGSKTDDISIKKSA